LAHASRLELICRVPCDDDWQAHKIVLTVLGDRLAFYSEVELDGLDEVGYPYWSLHVWNWREGGQSDDIYLLDDGYTLSETRFLTKEKLLALTSRCQIELYDVENLSKAPQLQARFMVPVTPQFLSLEYPSVFHSTSSCAHLAAPDEHWIWTTIPADRVICLETYYPRSIFVISARPFFMDIPSKWFDATSVYGLTIPWSSWGPQNSRCFLQSVDSRFSPFGVGGSRVVWSVIGQSWRMNMTDFNPSAVARGVGKVVREPTTIPASMYGFTQDVTTYLPYTEAVDNHARPFCLYGVLVDEERILILTRANTSDSEWMVGVEIIGM